MLHILLLAPTCQGQAIISLPLWQYSDIYTCLLFGGLFSWEVVYQETATKLPKLRLNIFSKQKVSSQIPFPAIHTNAFGNTSMTMTQSGLIECYTLDQERFMLLGTYSCV